MSRDSPRKARVSAPNCGTRHTPKTRRGAEKTAPLCLFFRQTGTASGPRPPPLAGMRRDAPRQGDPSPEIGYTDEISSRNARIFPPRHFTNSIFYVTMYKFRRKRAPRASRTRMRKRIPRTRQPFGFCGTVRAPKRKPQRKRNKPKTKPKQNGKYKGDPR